MAKTQAETLSEVNRIFCEVLDNPALQLSYKTTAREVNNWDSLTHVELVVAIEMHFKIRFNFAELQNFKNVGEWCDNILLKVNGMK